MKIRASEKPESRDKTSTMGSVRNMRNGRIPEMDVSEMQILHGQGKLTGDQNLAHGEALFVRCELIGTPQVEGLSVLFALLAASLCDAVHHDGRPCFRNKEEVYDLGGTTEDELDPDVPAPGQELLDETTDDGTQN